MLSLIYLGKVYAVRRKDVEEACEALFSEHPNVPNPTFSNVLTFSPAHLVHCTASVMNSQVTLNYVVAPFMLSEF